MHATRTPHYDIVIVGLGPVGALAGNLAGAAGFKTLIIERAETPYLKPRAIVFDAEIMRIFNSVGLADAVAAASRPLGGSVYLGADHKPIRTFRTRPAQHPLEWRSSNLFYQPKLEAILREGLGRFSNVTVLLEHEADNFMQDEQQARLAVRNLRSGEISDVSASYVLACDGASSSIRKQLGIALDDIGFEERWLVVDTLVDGEMRWPTEYEIPDEVKSGECSLMVCDPARPSTLIPGVGRHRRWELMLLAGESEEDAVAEPRLRELIGRWIDPVHVEIIRAAVYRFRALVAERWRVGRTFLLGDAAHQTPPFFGQGMCHGMRDAAQLLWRLTLVRDGGALPAILDDYQVEREPHVREIIAAAVAAGAAVCKRDPMEAAKRDAEFRAAEAARGDARIAMADVVPPLREGFIDALPNAESAAGQRLPDFALGADKARLARLDDALAGGFGLITTDKNVSIPERLLPRWSKLGGRALTVHASEARHPDFGGRIAQWLDAHKANWALVRPDRYVYATGKDTRELEAALGALLLRLRPLDAGHEAAAPRPRKDMGLT